MCPCKAVVAFSERQPAPNELGHQLILCHCTRGVFM